MADRIYPSAKPNPQPTSTIPPPPPIKSQTYQRPMYRPTPTKSRRRSGRSCCRCCCCYLLLVIVLLILLVAIAGGVFYFLYKPHRPTFTVSSVRLSTLNLTASNLLTSNVDLTVVAHNPNKKIVYIYDDISIRVSTTNDVDIGDGSVPGFVHDAKNSTTINTVAGVRKQSVDSSLTSDLKKSKLQLAVDLETKAGVKVGKLTTKKVGIKVHCEGFQAAAPVKGKPGAVDTANVACKVKLRIKIWKWTF